MPIKFSQNYILRGLLIFYSLGIFQVVFSVSTNSLAKASIQQGVLQDTLAQDTIPDGPYEPQSHPDVDIQYRYGDPYSERRPTSPLFFPENPGLETTLEFDSISGDDYTVREKVGNTNVRPPSEMTFEEYNRYHSEQTNQRYFRNRSQGLDGESAVSGRRLIPPIYTSPVFDRIFGGSYVDIRPNGYVTLDFGGRWQRIDNPSIPIRQQRTGSFEFDQQISMNVVGQVGEKLAVTANFDNNNSFDFQNDLKVEYTGYEEEIIKKIELGNVNLPVNNSLISGSQSLFGVKTQLQFGKLYVTGVASRQQGSSDVVTIQGGRGGQGQQFEIKASEYDENRHFFLSHFFRKNYENWLKTIPQVTSGLNVTRVEVYVINRSNDTETLRNITAFMDLGEGARIYRDGNPNVGSGQGNVPPSNDANKLFQSLENTPGIRDVDQVSDILETDFSFVKSTDFEKISGARKLSEQEYTLNSELGYISLNRRLQNDEVLAVSYEYTYNGQRHKVGELTEDYQNRQDDEVIFMKLLRPSKINTDVPTWDLMMKNIYSLNASQVTREGFEMRIIYRDDRTGVDNPSLHEGQNTKNEPLIELLGLDELNQNNDPQPDGNFDFVEGITFRQESGSIIFPVLEPFGNQLRQQFTASEENLISKYVYDTLYNTTQSDAELMTSKNKFYLVGRYQSGSASEIMLPGINVAENSVTVLAGNTPLTEGTDYTVDYNIGKVNIINESVLNSGQDIRIQYEKADLFNFQSRFLFGSRMDYRFNDNFNLGATVLHLNERPIVSRVNIGDEPTKNTKYGFDLSYQKESRFMTRMVDFLPLIQTKAKSNISANAEFAQLLPGTSNIVKGEGAAYLDDFENTVTPFNMGGDIQRWSHASVPKTEKDQFDKSNQTPGDLGAGYKRAKIAWYIVDNVFYRDGGIRRRKPDNIPDEIQNHYTRGVNPQEIFKKRDPEVIQPNLNIFDIAYFPEERGIYNYNPDLTEDGRLKNPEENWGGITRAVTSDVDFDKTNIEYIEFWMMDPFIKGPNGKVLDGSENPQNNTTGGELIFNLGSVSEDWIPDERHTFENGLPAEGGMEGVDSTVWGRVTTRQYLNNAFANSPSARENQDIGLDGLKSTQEREWYQAFLNQVSLNEEARERIENDPGADDFQYYLGSALDNRDAQILERYKNYNGLEGNSPLADEGLNYAASGSPTPDNEDLNRDNTISDLEEYYEYKIDLKPGEMQVGQNYIVDEVTSNKRGDEVKWYLFRIPVRQPDDKQGDISGFKSIRFMRTYLTDFSQPVVLRFADFQLVGSQWRRFEGNLYRKGLYEYPEPYNANFTISAVNIEENSEGGEVNSPYVLPPGIERDLDNTSTIERRANEQSLQMCVDGLRDKDARAAFKNISLDLINYGRLKMFLHADSRDAQDGEVNAFIRLGTDYEENYYEIEVPLQITPPNTSAPEDIWPKANEIDIAFESLYSLKSERDRKGVDVSLPYSDSLQNKYRITVVGRPDLSAVETAMIGIRNPESPDQAPKSVCVWANELRVSDFNYEKGWAANARVNAKLADFANISATTRHTTFGFGGIQSRISDRTREETTEFDVAANVNLDKLLPEELGLKIPMYASYQASSIMPRYDPLDPDIPLRASLNAIEDQQERAQYRSKVEDLAERRSLNFTNVRKIKTNEDSKSRIYDLSNFSFTYAYSEISRRNINTAAYEQRRYRGALSYNYNFPEFSVRPFGNVDAMNSPWLGLIKDFNFSPLPSNVNLRADLNRNFVKTQRRNADLTTIGIQPTYQKTFTFDRLYDLRWNLAQSLTLDYSARANSVIDEPDGDINTEAKKDSLWNNIRRLGRLKNFNQSVRANYSLPLDKFPVTDWISADLRYTVGYTWEAGARLLADTLGNVIQNNRERSVNGRLDLVGLYNKVGFLKNINQSSGGQGSRRSQDQDGEEGDDEGSSGSSFVKGFVRSLMSVRSISFDFSINEGTRLPGFMPDLYMFGMDSSLSAPGVPFLMGSQDPGIRRRAARNNWLAPSPSLTIPFSQSNTENLNIQAQVEPARNLRIQVNARKTKSNRYQEIFRRDTTGMAGINGYTSFNPSRNGAYSISFFTLPTSFIEDKADNQSPVFNDFENYRKIVKDRLENVNTGRPGEYQMNSQDVLLPAFLAAYSGRDPETIGLSPFPSIPLPNWRMDYSGLTSVFPGLQEVFSSLSITHGYNASYDVNSFSNSLLYQEGLNLDNAVEDYPLASRQNDNGDLVPAYVIQRVSISERFSPLIGINVRTKTRITGRIAYNRERNLALNLSNAQMTELKSKDITFEFGYTKSGFTLPFRVQGRTITLDNDLTFRLGVTFRDTKTVQRKLDDINTITNGNINFQFRPNINYVVNDRLNVQLYFERTVNDPRVSNSFKRTSTSFGTQVKFSLAQ